MAECRGRASAGFGQSPERCAKHSSCAERNAARSAAPPRSGERKSAKRVWGKTRTPVPRFPQICDFANRQNHRSIAFFCRWQKKAICALKNTATYNQQPLLSNRRPRSAAADRRAFRHRTSDSPEPDLSCSAAPFPSRKTARQRRRRRS